MTLTPHRYNNALFSCVNVIAISNFEGGGTVIITVDHRTTPNLSLEKRGGVPLN